MNPVETHHLTKQYGAVSALSDVSFSVSEGEFLTVMGTSGSGKSTLLHLIAGLMKPTSGSVLVNGGDISTMSDSRRTRFRRKNIGVVFQAFNLIPTLSAEENILLPTQLEKGMNVPKERLNELLNLLEIGERRKHRPDALSGGEQQRVAIGRTLIMEPAIILADEPTGNLDSVNSATICKLLRKLCDEQKRTIILVTHDTTVAEYGDRKIELRDGKIVES
jgi:putative ABC transport system ATP-binding protein